MLDDDAVLERASTLRAACKPFALITVVRSELAKPGAKAVIEPDGALYGRVDAGRAQPAVIGVAMTALADGHPRLIRVNPDLNAAIEEGMAEFETARRGGGTLDIFIDPVITRPGLLVIGAGRVAQSLSALAMRTGFTVTVAAAGARGDQFEDAERVVEGLDSGALPFGAAQFVVVASEGTDNEEALEMALATGSRNIALVAGEHDAARLRTRLLERGHDRPRVDAIVSSAGMDIGAVTPEEIALSVLAGLVRTRRIGIAAGTGVTQREGAGTRETGRQVERPAQDERPSSTAGAKPTPRAEAARVVESAPVSTGKTVVTGMMAPAKPPSTTPAGAVDPVCGMAFEHTTAPYRTEYAGKIYYFCCAHCKQSFEKTPENYLGKVTGAG
jgi:xanthine dehydrogenase accessory factor